LLVAAKRWRSLSKLIQLTKNKLRNQKEECSAKNCCEKPKGNKKWHGTQLTALEVLVYPETISEPTP